MSEPYAEAVPKRRRDAAATRSAILEAATGRFASRGYRHAGLREIAADAGVTAALVNRYFGSKEALFAEVIERAFDIRDLIEGDRETLADRLAHLIVHGREGTPEGTRAPLLLLLRCASEPLAAELLRNSLDQNNLRLLADQIGGPDAEARAAMVIAQLTGFAILDQILKPRAFTEASRACLQALISESLANCLGPVIGSGEDGGGVRSESVSEGQGPEREGREVG